MNFKHLIIYLLICMSLAAASIRLSGQTSGINLRPRVYLQGALQGLLPAATLMRDDLRAQGLIPMTEPYSALNYQFVGEGGESITSPAVFQATGGNAIVDWVIVELRSSMYLDEVFASRSALVQRDGDVVDLDGVSPLNFPNASPGSYHVVIRHRNHLGVMTSESVNLGENAVSVDFTNPDFPINCGQHGMATIGSKRALWAGDLNHDGRMIYQGPNNDVFKIFTTVISDSGNTTASPSFISKGYLQADTNMDGKAIFSGSGNDRLLILQEFLQFYNPNLFEPYITVLVECIP